MHPDDRIVSSRAAAHGPPGTGKSSKASGGHKTRQDKSHYPGADDDEEEIDMSLYSNMKFPPYEFKEWPKYVTHPVSGVGKVCANSSEELDYIQTNADGSKELSPVEKERDALAREVAELRAQLTPPQQQEAKKAAEIKSVMGTPKR